ncbi:NAD(P)/FAD-dependent oxidoreductase [Desulfurivibrio alkaliphilus]|uniref:HI0933 family protein n=1 Tax=Desulfurivibrio alkaliphilus (strain DSM 19089 / UNIQEM U267 / AHT2) TaxID=589865 RepID=D6Z3B0_DESAT|nr:NAD(P)/FAD-dependent oxidoreductase [Desulfurivibrio alkaliphilus]ADH86035.1 HI0933 family protein [Desulfurivibrio alkaliphilus AHT 2]
MPISSAHTIIIGAGPAGLACATALAAAGREVLVLERLSTAGPKPCAGGVPAGSLEPDMPPELLERSFHRQRIVTACQDFQFQGEDPIIHTINRERLGSWMQQRAEAAGAVIQTGTRALRINGRTLTTDQGEISFQYLVGADGSNSLVRRHLGLPLVLAGIGITYQVPGHFPEMEWHLQPRLFGSGYAWIFPHRDSASVGVYAFRRRQRSHLLHDRLHLWAEKRGLRLDQARPRASLVSFDYRGSRFGSLFLAGDAAGLASGLTGEGIAAALYSGRAVAATILKDHGQAPDLAPLLSRHRQHSRLVRLTTALPPAGRLILETLALALRWRLLQPDSLEIRARHQAGTP